MMRRREFVSLAAAGAFAVPSLARHLGAATTAAPSARPTEYEFLRRIPPERLRALIGDRPDANGLSGSNRLAGRWLEAGPQRGSCRGVIAGVVLDDLALAEDAWRGIEVAFAHQRDDGGFVANLRPNGKSARPFGAAVETAFFFLQEMGRAVLVIRQSPHEPVFRERLAALEPKLRRAGRFILSGYDTIIDNSSKAVNRIFIAAKAFGLCGRVLRDEEVLAAAHRLVAHGLTLRDAQGIFIENGGRDSSYNAVSILFGQVLALHVPIPEFEAALPAAVAWQISRIRPDGSIEVEGNSRTGVGKEKSYFGDPKTVNHGEIVQALTLYGIVHGDRAALAAADRVFAFWKSGAPAKVAG
ncbi:MAG: hypothetical protein FJ382_07075 [Verrucomicrobia bacterium]|nr:hypothetical protein [Verrucomicrobiota bacterium]